jgi:hypothetical protein
MTEYLKTLYTGKWTNSLSSSFYFEALGLKNVLNTVYIFIVSSYDILNDNFIWLWASTIN